MSIALRARPAFGRPLMNPQYYEQVDSILRVLRPVATLRVLADHLTKAGFTTPSGKQWDRIKVATYLRGRYI